MNRINVANNRLTALPMSLIPQLQSAIIFGNKFNVIPVMDILDNKEQLRGVIYRDANGKSNRGINMHFTELAKSGHLHYLDFVHELKRYGGFDSPFLDHLRTLGGASDILAEINKHRIE